MFNEQQASAWKSEEMFRLLVSGIKNYAIIFLDTDGAVRSWNEGAERVLGFSSEEIQGAHFSRFYPEEQMSTGQPEVQLRLTRMSRKIE